MDRGQMLGFFAVVLAGLLLVSSSAVAEQKSFLAVKRTIFVDNVWTGARTMCPIITRDGVQYVAYYDADRQMTVAARSIDSDKWTYKRLDDHIMWDSHCYISLGMDSEGYIHVSGNMHGIPLRYYRSTKPGDVTSLVGVHAMTGDREKRVTYPTFFNGANGELFFMYRDGSSGNGDNLINAYDTKTQTWSRVGGKSLIDGEGLMNAYQCRPKLDRKGVFNIAWVWRDTGDIVTNHDVCYARTVGGSLDNWCGSDGSLFKLPITLTTAEIIDHVSVRSGLRNNVQLSFDAQDRPMVTYVKYRPKDKSVTQIYVMRLEDSIWKRYQTTAWTDTDEFSGGGTIGAKIRFASPAPCADSKLLYHVFVNEFIGPYVQIRFLDSQTLQPVTAPVRLYPAELEILPKEEADTWSINWNGPDLDNWVSFDMNALEKQGSVCVLRWKTLRPNRDKPRESMPPPSRLEVIEFKRAAADPSQNRRLATLVPELGSG